MSPTGKTTTYTFVLKPETGDNIEAYYFDNYVVTITDKKITELIVRYQPSNDWLQNSYGDFDSFTGNITFYELDGSIIDQLTSEGGATKSNFNQEKAQCNLVLDSTKIICSQLIDENGSPIGVPDCLTTYIYKFECTMGGGTIGDEDTGHDPTNPRQVDGNWTPPSLPAEVLPVKIASELKDTCAEEIIWDFLLEDFSNPFVSDPLINETFDALSSTGSPINITYTSQNITGHGHTSEPVYNPITGKYDIEIKIDTDLMNNGTKLAIAKTILHETLHAYLLYVRRTNPQSFNDENGDFSDLVKGYNTHKHLGYAHHVYMANLISNVGSQLSHYAINYMGYPNHSNSYPTNTINEYYEYVAWSGIAITPYNSSNDVTINPVFSSMYPSTADQNKIINIFNSENFGTVVDGYSPIINNNCN